LPKTDSTARGFSPGTHGLINLTNNNCLLLAFWWRHNYYATQLNYYEQ